MLGGWPRGGVWLARDPADMRKSFDGLQALVRQHLGDDPLSGRWYVFINRRRTLCKVLCFEAGGFCIWAKRLEKGLFASLTCGRSGKRVLSRAEFHALVDGLEIRVTGRRRRWLGGPKGS